MKNAICLFLFLFLIAFKPLQDDRTLYFPKTVEKVERSPNKNKVWVFVMAGQSNMAGRGFVEPQDTIPNKRILTINAAGELIYAKEPLHFYEPTLAGLDCGLSFGKTIIKNIPGNISILLIPTAIGGSSINQWLGDSTYRNVQLLSNFRQKVDLARKFGQFKGLLWHQGESDAYKNLTPLYENRLSTLLTIFRNTIQDKNLPVVIGELGPFSDNKEDWNAINTAIRNYGQKDKRVAVVSTQDLKDKGDNIHFNSEGQRKLGERYAQAYLKLVQKSK